MLIAGFIGSLIAVSTSIQVTLLTCGSQSERLGVATSEMGNLLG